MGETFGAFGDQHHMRTIFEDFAGEAHGIAHVLKSGDSAGTESGAVHDDGVTFNFAVEIEMGSVASVKNGIVFQDHDSRFNGVERGSASFQNAPPSGQGSFATGFTGEDGRIGNIPSTAMDDQRWIHG
jgi:hypothetical protein